VIIIPAIDIKEGKVVRLSQGRFNEMTIYSDDPVAVAKQWQDAGAAWLHVVDLDGAEKGKIQNLEIISNIARCVNIPIQMGGGIRTFEDVESILLHGVKRVIIGTKVIDDKKFLQDLLLKWPRQITVSLDCSRGFLAQKGWTSFSSLKATDFAKELEDMGLSCLIYTDISRDGTLKGPNIASIKELLDAVKIPVIASGGVSSLDDIRALKKLQADGLAGAIVGKAIYENRFSLQSAIDLCLQSE